MDANMSEKTKEELMFMMRSRYANAGREHRIKLIDRAVDLMGYHRKSAIRALNSKRKIRIGTGAKAGRPQRYEHQLLLEPLKAIWLAGKQPCGKRLAGMMPDWVPAFENYHHSLSSGIKEQLLEMSSATLDRFLSPLRSQYKPKRRGTAPGTMLRQEIPIRTGTWQESEPGWLEADTVALCGGSSFGEVIWMMDTTDICTTWVEQRAMFGRGQHAAVEQLTAIERDLPFVWLGLDSDNGGEFMNYHVMAWCSKNRAAPIFYTRSRPCHSNDNARIEQKNWTHVRQWFGYDRHDNPEVAGLINHLAGGKLRTYQNLFSASQKLESKTQENGREKRKYGKAMTPFARAMASAKVTAEKKLELQKLKDSSNPFALEAAIEKELRKIWKVRRALA
jgi:hypothetical protein